MMKHSSLLAAALILSAQVHAADPVVKLAGVQAVFDDGQEHFDGFRTYNSEKGIGITLIVSSDKQISACDENTVAVKIGGAKAEGHFFGDSNYSKDRKFLRLELFAKGKYEVGPDGSVKVTGEIPMTVSSGQQETKSTPFKATAGTKIAFPADAAGMPELAVKSTEKSKFDEKSYEVVFTTNRKPDEFAGIRFLGADGKEIEAERHSTSFMSFGGKGSGEVTYAFKSAPAGDLVLAIATYKGAETVKVKVELSAGLAAPK